MYFLKAPKSSLELQSNFDYAYEMKKIESKSGKWALYGDADAQIIVCGHSHAASILQANLHPDSTSSRYPKISVCYTSEWIDGPPGDKNYWEFVARMGCGKHLVIVWNGNQHNESFIFQTSPLFTLSGVVNDSNDKATIPVPKNLIKAFFQPSFEELSRIIPTMSDALSVTLLSGPAPMPRSHIKNVIGEDKFYTEIANDLGLDVDSLSVSCDSLRLQLWNVLTEMLGDHATEFGVNFLEAPKVSQNNDGMLLEQYWGDVTHANTAYGHLLIRELAYLIGGVPR